MTARIIEFPNPEEVRDEAATPAVCDDCRTPQTCLELEICICHTRLGEVVDLVERRS